MPIGCLLADADQRFRAWNPAAEAIFGYTAAEALGKTCWELNIVPDSARAYVEDIVRRLYAGDSTAQGVNENRTKDGRIIVCDWLNTPLLRPDGSVEGVVSMIQDVTDRVRARNELAQSQAWLHAVLTASREGIVVEENEHIIFANEAFARMCGYERGEELHGLHASAVQMPEDHACMAEYGGRRLRGEPAPVVYTFRGRRKDGFAVDLEASVSTFRTDGRDFILTVVRDLTERHRLEEQLRQAQKMEAVGRLAGGVAHDFNNLLTVINGFCDIGLNALAPKHAARSSLEEVKRAGDRAAALTRQLLAFSRKQVLAPKLIDLNAVVRDMDKMLARVLGEDIGLKVHLRDGLPPVRVDPGQIEQVVLNMALNARDAMPRGGTLALETSSVSFPAGLGDVPPGNYLMLVVGDTGCGMTAQTLQRIFEPFFTTKEQGKGTGLGLATVYGIIRQSNGYVRVDSEYGAGTTFYIYLPLAADHEHEQASLHDASAAYRGQETILLVEDDQRVRSLARLVLQGAGYSLLEAGHGVEAERLCRQHGGPIHLLVTDVVMPHANGRQVADQVRSLHPETKVLYVSGYMDDSVVRHGILHDAVNFLPKPYTPNVLTRKVREVLDSAV